MRTYKRKTFKKPVKKYVKRTKVMRQLSKYKSGNLVNAKRTVEYTPIPLSGAPNQFYAAKFAFRLNMLDDYSDFVNLYKQYRICGLKVTLLPGQNSLELGNNVSFQNPIFFHKVVSDGDIPSSLSKFMQQNPRITNYNKPINIYIRYPKIIYEIGNNPLIGSGEAPKGGQWLDMESADVNHYGLTYGWTTPTGGIGSESEYGRYSVFVTYYLQFKGIR